MSVFVFNINSPHDISWSSFRAGTLQDYTNSEVTWSPSLTFQNVIDSANGLLSAELGGSGFDSILLYVEPNYVLQEDLGELVPEGAILLIFASSILQDPNTIGNLIVNTLNGLTSFITGCPCTDLLNSGNCTTNGNRGLWALITREFPISEGGANSFLAPCFNPGSSIQVSAGALPFFGVTAQVMRIRNFDRVKFLKVSTGFKECTKTMVINIIGQTCGFITGFDTRFGIDVSVQATALGQNLFPDPKFCDALPETVKNQDCAIAQSCVQVFLPATIIEMSLEVALLPGDPITCATGSSRKLDWSNTSLNLNFNFTDKPDFYYPGLIINDDFRVQLESAMLQLTNGVMRETISKIIADKLSPFVNEFLQRLNTLTNFSFCVDFPTPSRIKCSSEQPILPAECDLCDECCLCLTRGDCGDLCRQECPCVVPFCKSLKRTIDPIWWFIFIIITILMVISIFLLARVVKGIGR